MASDNKSLGQFNLDGILPAPRGIPQIDVSFDLDVNGILKVSAKDKATGKEQSIRIEGSSKLSDDEINRIKAEAEKYAEADKKAKETADAINKGDALVIAQEKLIKDQENNLTSDEKSKLEGLVNDLKEAVKDKNVDKINSLEATINETWQTISQRVYGQQQAQGGAEQQQQTTEQSDFDAATASTENVTDAEFEEVK